MQGRDTAASLSSDPLGSTPFRALRQLGEGSMGVVYEAEHRLLRYRVVVKVLRAERATDPSMSDRLRLEAQAAASLRHNPHVVQVSDLGCLPDGTPYLVMEKLEGRDLRAEVADRGPLPIAEAVALARQVLAGLAAAHAIGIVHRDIKPANLFLCRSEGAMGVLKILDFGIAKVLETADRDRAPSPLTKPTQEGLALGTPHYLSPEQAQGRPVDGRSDIYAVGAVLYWLLAGRAPFQHRRGGFAVMGAHVTEQPAPPSAFATQAIPAALDAAILKALAKAPGERFETAEAFSLELARIVERAPRPTAPTQPIDAGELRAAPQEHAAGGAEVGPRRDSAIQTLRWATAKPAAEQLPAEQGEEQRDSATVVLPASKTSPSGSGLADPPGHAQRPTSATGVRRPGARRGLYLAALASAAVAVALALILLVRALSAL